MGPEDAADRTVDEATLRYLAGVVGRQPDVHGTSLFPSNKQESLVVDLNEDYYPEPIEAVRLELRLYTSGDFHVSYVEDYLGERRHCRWDRHDQNHSTRDHFHPLPAASTTAAEDRDFPADLITTVETVVLPWVEDRFETVWEE